MEIVSQALRRHGYETASASDGDAALEKVFSLRPDLVILDLMLPKMDGWEVCRRMRAEPETERIPILMLTARRDERDVVEGLELGADDYMKKPFSLAELTARVKALLRRTGERRESRIVENGDLRIELDDETALLRGTPLDLSPTEFRLLEALARKMGRTASREELLSKIWSFTAATRGPWTCISLACGRSLTTESLRRWLSTPFEGEGIVWCGSDVHVHVEEKDCRGDLAGGDARVRYQLAAAVRGGAERHRPPEHAGAFAADGASCGVAEGRRYGAIYRECGKMGGYSPRTGHADRRQRRGACRHGAEPGGDGKPPDQAGGEGGPASGEGPRCATARRRTCTHLLRPQGGGRGARRGTQGGVPAGILSEASRRPGTSSSSIFRRRGC